MAHFPDRIRALPEFEGPFDAFRLGADRCDVLFASYPGGTRIDAHSHNTANYGVITQGELILTMDGKDWKFAVGDWYHIPANAVHAARFDVDTSEIEFWFDPEAQGL